MNYKTINTQETYRPEFIEFNYNRYLALYQLRNQLQPNRTKNLMLWESVEKFGTMLIQLNMLTSAQHRYNKKMQSHQYN